MDIDNHIYTKFKEGDLDAFYSKAYASLLSAVVKMLPKDQAFLAEDLVQDSIFSAYKNRSNFNSPANLKSYLYSCVHNEAVTLIRKHSSKMRYADVLPAIPMDLSVEGKIMIQETLDRLYNAISELPEEYRQIFELSFVQGLTNVEVAEILNLSLSGTKKRKARFVEMIRAKLSESDDLLLWLLFMEIDKIMMS